MSIFEDKFFKGKLMVKKTTLFLFVALAGGIFSACEDMENANTSSAAKVSSENYQVVSFDEDYAINEISDELQLPDFKKYEDAGKRKKKFFDFMRPIIEAENQRVMAQRNFVKKSLGAYKLGWTMTEERLNRLEKLAVQYRVKNADFQSRETYKKLLMRIDKVPVSLALIQAANESAWGTSYFAREGNNMFGQWCFTGGCGLVPRNRPEGAKHEVAVYPSVAHSVRAYIHNLNTHRAYSHFRNLRYELRQNNKPLDGDYLAPGLQRYSSKGMEYVSIIRSMLKSNDDFFHKEA